MTINEELIDETRIRQFKLLRVDASNRNNANKQLAELGNDLAELTAGAQFGVRRSTIIDRKNELFKEASTQIRSTYSQLGRQHIKDLRELSELEIDFVNVSVAGIIGASALPSKTVNPSNIIDVINDSVIEGNTVKQWWNQNANNNILAFKLAVNEGQSIGETGTALAQRVKGGSRQGSPIIGIMNRAKKNAGSLIRTGNQVVINKVRLLAYQANPNINGITQISIFDSKTSQICIAYGGKKWDLNLKPIGHTLPWLNGPPRHFNCRSSTAPIKDLKENVEDVSFDVWLKGKNKTFQNELLGFGKANLWRNNSITLTELVNPIGRPLTLKELKGS